MSETILAIDPGSEQSAYVVMDGKHIFEFGIRKNGMLLVDLSAGDFCVLPVHLAIETLHVRGMPTAQQEMETQLWAGRFIQAAGLPFTQMRRMDEKMVICGHPRAMDGNIRQALIDRWGGKDKAIGKKKTPGPLYGISQDVWQALAIAVTWFEQQKLKASA